MSSLKYSARGEFGEIDSVVGCEQAIEIERQILMRGVGDNADGCAGNVFMQANLADGVGLHFDRVHAGHLPEFELFVGGAGDAIGAFEARKLGFRGEQRFIPRRTFVHVVDDCAEFERWIQSAGESTREHASRSLFREVSVDFREGVAPAHAGDEHADVGRRFEKFRLFFDGKADERRTAGGRGHYFAAISAAASAVFLPRAWRSLR
jgi:hypothetical protein